jgi:biopolymer transport protein TolR
MGGALPGRGSGGRRGRRTAAAFTDINVTPLVDVMLVLLVVFMVTAPLLSSGVPVDLPKSEAKTLSENEAPLVLTLTGDDKFYLQDTEFNQEQLVARLQAIVAEKKDTVIYVRGDKNVPYGKIMGMMGLVNKAGIEKVSLVTEGVSE